MRASGAATTALADDRPVQRPELDSVDVSLDALSGAPCSSSPGDLTVQVPSDFEILLVVRPSGSGVTTVLQQLGRHLGITAAPTMRVAGGSAVASEVKAARDWFPAVGLNDIKAWCHPYGALSNSVMLGFRMPCVNTHLLQASHRSQRGSCCRSSSSSCK